jgi:hypothetical protein
MTTIRETLDALNVIKEEETKQQLTEGTADTVRYITKTKELFNDMEDAETSEPELNEKWDTEMHTKEKDKGMFKGKTQSELKSKLSSLKDKQESHKEKHGKADKETSKKIKEVEFALRAKHKFGKVKESLEAVGGEHVMEAVKQIDELEAEFLSEFVE